VNAEPVGVESDSDDDPPYQLSGDVMRLQIPISKSISWARHDKQVKGITEASHEGSIGKGRLQSRIIVIVADVDHRFGAKVFHAADNEEKSSE